MRPRQALVQDWIVRIDVHEDRLAIQLKSADDEERSGATEENQFSIPWQKLPSRKPRQILLPHGASRSEVRPTRLERRARLVSAISRGRRWLEEMVSGSVTACERALAINAINYSSVSAILKSGLDRARPAAEPVKATPSHGNIRGGDYYQ
jgi:site-specific DNA recombinase